jgi:DHHC palmitoyltransferase
MALILLYFCRNYRWFLAYLISNSILMLYGAYGALTIFLSDIIRLDLMNATFVNNQTGAKIKAGYGIIFQYLMGRHNWLMMVTFIASLMGLVISGFTMYHLWLASSNTTTNETFKWKEARYHHREAEELWEEQVEATAKDLLQQPEIAGKLKDLEDARKYVRAKLEPPAPVPQWAYDTGSRWENLKEVIYPPSLYGRDKRWHEQFEKKVLPATASAQTEGKANGSAESSGNKKDEGKAAAPKAGGGKQGSNNSGNLKKRR